MSNRHCLSTLPETKTHQNNHNGNLRYRKSFNFLSIFRYTLYHKPFLFCFQILFTFVTMAVGTPIVVAPLNAPPKMIPDITTTMNNHTIIYNIVCGAMEVSPMVTLKDCRLEVISGIPLTGTPLINTDFGNVQLNSPLNVNDDAVIQNNQFANVHNFQTYGVREIQRPVNGTIEVAKKKN